MSEPPKSKGEQIIEGLMAGLDPASPRYRTLESAKRFKSSWVELGERLSEVQQKGLFREWGYDSFESYCAREIRIRQPTAAKLTLAYHFLEREEPQLLARHGELKPLPDYRSVDLLRRAKEQELPPARFAELRRAVVEEERSHPTVLKRFRDAASSLRPAEEADRQAMATALAAARRLAIALKSVPGLPRVHADAVLDLIAWLEERLPPAD